MVFNEQTRQNLLLHLNYKLYISEYHDDPFLDAKLLNIVRQNKALIRKDLFKYAKKSGLLTSSGHIGTLSHILSSNNLYTIEPQAHWKIMKQRPLSYYSNYQTNISLSDMIVFEIDDEFKMLEKLSDSQLARLSVSEKDKVLRNMLMSEGKRRKGSYNALIGSVANDLHNQFQPSPPTFLTVDGQGNIVNQ